MKFRMAMGVMLSAAMAAGGTSAALAQDEGTDVGNPDDPALKVIPRSADVAGQSYQDWIEEYGKWFFWERTLDNPPPDAIQDCNGGQPMGEVFFIPHTQFGNVTEFDCELRSDQHVLLWLGGSMDIVGPGESVDDAMQRYGVIPDHSHGFEFTIDGVTRPAGFHTIYHPSFYTVDLAEDNLFELPAGPREVSLFGSFVMLEPFEPGQHEVVVENHLYSAEVGEMSARAISSLTVTDAAAK